jgi:hypothetical protein
VGGAGKFRKIIVGGFGGVIYNAVYGKYGRTIFEAIAAAKKDSQ